MAHSLILGIGNVLMSDDGAGVHVARLLKRALVGKSGVDVLDAGTLSFTLAPMVEACERLIVLDAMELASAPGTVRTFLDGEADAVLGRARLSVHELGLRDLLQLARLAGRCPQHWALVGIQPACLDWGLSPTPPVCAALPGAAEAALRLLADRPRSSPAPQTSETRLT